MIWKHEKNFEGRDPADARIEGINFQQLGQK